MNASLVLGQTTFASSTFSVAQNGMQNPSHVVFDSFGNLWVADTINSRILEFVPPFSTGMNASLVLGQTIFTSSAATATQNGMYYPTGISFDAAGNLWVADRYNNRVLEFVPPFSNGMNASLVLGQTIFTSSAATVTQNGMYYPTGISFDAAGNLWMTDQFNNRVLEFVPPFSNGMNASLVLGQTIFTSSAATVTQNGMYYPTGISFDTPGNLWMADQFNHRVLEFSPPFSNGMNASSVLGQLNFTSTGTSATQNGVNTPYGVSIDAFGNLWVADWGNSRVMKFPGSMAANCVYGYDVKQDGSQNFTSIQAAVNALPQNLSGNECVVIRDTGTYNETVAVQGFTTNGYQVKIMADPTFVSSAPVISPPTAAVAALNIQNSSVTIQGLAITPMLGLSEGILVSSPDVVINNVFINDPSGFISGAGIYLGSSNNTISQSTITTGGYAVELAGTSDSSINQSAITSSGNDALLFLGASSNTVSSSRISGAVMAAYINGSTGTVINASAILSMGGYGVYIAAQSSGVVISNDSISISSGNSPGLFLGAGNFGLIDIASDAVTGASYGLDISPPAPTGALSISSITFSSLTPGATAINFLGSIVNSTFSAIDFADSSIGTDVNAVALSSFSAIFMRGDLGPRTGPQFADDPNGVILWPDHPTSAITAPASGSFINTLAAISGTAVARAGATVSSVNVAIQNVSSGAWWNGTSFVTSVIPVFNTASGTSVWFYAALPVFMSGASYKILSQAIDSAGRIQILSANSSFSFDSIPPITGITIPGNGVSLNSLPTISGTASDDMVISTVVLSIQDISLAAPNCYNPAVSSFTAACPAFFPAQGAPLAWAYSGIPWMSGHQYLIVSSATDAAGNSQSTFPVGISSNVFTFSGLVSGNAGDGQGTAFISPSSAAGCQVMIATLTFVAGINGIQPGGVIALNIPSGWSYPQGQAFNDPPSTPGYVYVNPSSGSVYGLQFNPTQVSSATLGNNWIVYTASSSLSPGATVQFVYTTFPAAGPLAQGPQVFGFDVQGGPGGNPKAIASAPSLILQPGPAANFMFAPNAPLTLGPLQNSSTMQLEITDACGLSTAAASNVAVYLHGDVNGSVDAAASFISGGATLPNANSLFQLTIPGGTSLSQGFQFNTSTSGISYENIIATSSFGGTTGVGYSSRYVQLLTSSVSISGVSIDTGILGTASNATILQNSPAGGTAFINFSPSNPALNWEVVISSNPSTFNPKVLDIFGGGNPGRTLAWNGINGVAFPNSFVSSGTYYVEIIAGGGAAVNTSLSVTVAPTASISGTISNGAGAGITVSGPGVGPGNFAAADANGNFDIQGLQNGGIYNIQASSSAIVSGTPVNLSTGAFNVVATASGNNIGTLAFVVPSHISISATLTQPAPVEIWGSASAHNASYSQNIAATIHFPQGSLQSDNGAQNFGTTASTWTEMFLQPDTYTVSVFLPSVNLSTQAIGIVIPSNAAVQLPLTLTQEANVYGYAFLPAPASSAGAQVSVQATQQGGTGNPSIFGGAFVPPASSSGVYSLFGLSPGSWTITAQSQGYIGISSAIFIAGTADIGTSIGGGFNLNLQTGGIITGTITVSGDTSQESGLNTCFMVESGFCVKINAYSPSSISGQIAYVHLATSTTQTSSTFSIAGLPDGTYFLSPSLSGFIGGSQTALVSSGSGSANMAMSAADNGLSVTVVLPGGPHPPSDFKAVSLGYDNNQGYLQSLDDMTQGTTTQYFISSATVFFPNLNPGLYSVDAFYKSDGKFKSASVPLAANSTATITLDLSGSTYSVSGALSFSGNLSLPQPGGLSIMVSSAAGWLAQTSTISYCVVGSPNGETLPAAQMQLLPAGPNGKFYNGALATPSGFPGCTDMILGNGQYNPNPFRVYLTTINADGTFSFPAVPPGSYLLQNNSQLDTNGDFITRFSQTILVTATVSGIPFPIGSGYSISGNILSPAQTPLSRTVMLRLMDSNGNQISQTFPAFNNSPLTPFLFSQIAPGNYTILTQDGVYPQAYTAKPVSVEINGQSLSGQNIQLIPSGAIKFRLAVEQQLISGGNQFLQVTQNNETMLPASFRIQAMADPWFTGGIGSAQMQDGLPFFDTNNQGVISGLLPGNYDVNTLIGNGPSANTAGLVGANVPGITVTGGNITDMGTIHVLIGNQISGYITDANGIPLSNVNVEAKPSQRSAGISSQRILVATDGSGYYALNGMDPNVRYYDIYAAARGDNEQQGEVLAPYGQQIAPAVDISSVTSMNFRLALATFSISGQVVAPAGGQSLEIPFGGSSQQAQPGATIFIQKVGVIPTLTPLGDTEFNTDINGNFTVPSFSTGVYRLTAVSLGYASFGQNVAISTGSPNVGIITMTQGSTLSGSIVNPDGSSPSESEVNSLVAATPDLSSVLVGSIQSNPNSQTVTGYSVAGFQTGLPYRLLIIDSNNNMVAPQEADDIVFSSTSSATLNIVYRPSPPLIMSKAFQQGGGIQIEFDISQSLREKTAADDNLSLILSTVSAQGTLSKAAISQDRTKISAFYVPSLLESSFTLHVKAYSNQINPSSLDPVNPQFIAETTATFFTGITALGQSNIQNYIGGDVLAQGNSGRITLPPDALNVNISSSVQVTLQLAQEPLTGVSVLGMSGGAARISALSHSPASYPSEIVSAVAAVPPSVNPLSAFYNIFLPLGVSTMLSQPAQLTLAYSTAVVDPTTLNVYWFNPAANEYVLQQDVTGAPTAIDSINRTLTINIGHFSTYVLFASNQSVITGSGGATSFSVHNFPNPFDLTSKTVNPQHTGSACGLACTIRGTMIAISLPPDISGDATVDIFNVVGTKVRHMDLGTLAGGSFYYQNWDGTNNSGRDVASGVYFGELKVGGQKKFFKMAIIKGSGL
ncbi:MAG: right-handed parallel beta-helix repeat-containing protein [Elusimicrobiota bacterium]